MAADKNNIEVRRIAVDDLIPWEKNRRTDLGDLSDLAQDINQNGILQPLGVRESNGKFEVIFGRRRLEAAKSIGLVEVPCQLLEGDDEQLEWISLAENLQRKSLKPDEEVYAFLSWQEKGLTPEEISDRAKVSVSYVRRRLQLAGLEESILTDLADGKIRLNAALELARVADTDKQLEAYEDAKQRYEGPTLQNIRNCIGYRKAVGDLSQAKWNIKKPYADRPACESCPHKGDHQLTLLDIKAEEDDEDDVTCYNLECFHAKAKFWADARREKAEKLGQKVLTEDEYSKIRFTPNVNNFWGRPLKGCTKCGHGFGLVFDSNDILSDEICTNGDCYRARSRGDDYDPSTSEQESTVAGADDSKDLRRQTKEKNHFKDWARGLEEQSAAARLGGTIIPGIIEPLESSDSANDDNDFNHHTLLAAIAFQILKSSYVNTDKVCLEAGLIGEDETTCYGCNLMEILIEAATEVLIKVIVNSARDSVFTIGRPELQALISDFNYQLNDTFVIDEKLLTGLSKDTVIEIASELGIEGQKSKKAAIKAIVEIPIAQRMEIPAALQHVFSPPDKQEDAGAEA